MKSVKYYLEKIKIMDFHDYLNHLQCFLAKIKGLLFYSFIFGKFGRGSWIKKPDQIFGATQIFIDENVRIEKGAVLYSIRKYAENKYSGTIKIGKRTFINRYFNASSAIGIYIGEGVAFGSNVFLCDFDHSYKDPLISRIDTPLTTKGPINIHDYCWLGANVYVTSGVTLGKGCVVGANSVVTSSFPPYTMIAGIPARAIKRYDFSRNQWVRIREAKPTTEC